ncbi:MAG: hypothetical protein EHM45_21080, partial [Desulfobacteraceae bacterium]
MERGNFEKKNNIKPDECRIIQHLHIDLMASLIVFIGSFLAFFGALLLLNIRHGNRKSNMWFALFAIGMAGFLLRGYLMLSGDYARFPMFTQLVDNVRYILSPALYFYIRTASDNCFSLRKYDLLHLVPVSLNLAVTYPFYALDRIEQVFYLTQWLHGPLTQPVLFRESFSRLAFFVYFCFFTYLSLRHFLRNRPRIEKDSLFGPLFASWIRLFFWAAIPVFLLWVFCAVTALSNRSFVSALSILYVFTAGTVFVCIIKLFSRPEILYRARPVKSDKKYPASGLNGPEADRCYARLIELMEKEEEYLNPDLNLQELAGKLNIHKNYLSQIINEKTGRT